jgi:hypothetical protein
MRLAEVEAWALRIIDGVRSGVRQEDTRVELKGEWIADRQKLARQLAGSCNAARGSEVLWLFGGPVHADAPCGGRPRPDDGQGKQPA